jgi:hypothetical protein
MLRNQLLPLGIRGGKGPLGLGVEAWCPPLPVEVGALPPGTPQYG